MGSRNGQKPTLSPLLTPEKADRPSSLLPETEKIVRSNLNTIELVAIQHCFERQARAWQEVQLAQAEANEVLTSMGVTLPEGGQIQLKLVGTDLVQVLEA